METVEEIILPDFDPNQIPTSNLIELRDGKTYYELRYIYLIKRH